MKATGGKANPAQLNDLLKAKLRRLAVTMHDPRLACIASCSSTIRFAATWCISMPPGAALIEHREYPRGVRDSLGEAVAASLLLAATIKFDGVLSLQLQGDGPVQLLLAQCTSGLGVRGLARYREDAFAPGTAETPPAGIAALIGAGNLTVTLETDDGAQRYQGIVPLAGGRLADSLQMYFENSEQLPTRLWLYADGGAPAGMLLQRLPEGPAPRARHRPTIDDAWRRVQLIGETLTPEELRDARRPSRCCTGCSTRTTCGCSSPRRCISAAAARASG